MFSSIKKLNVAVFALAAMVAGLCVSAQAADDVEQVGETRRSNLGTIKGVVRDHAGKPIADATVAIFKLGTSKLLKQVRSSNDGSFLTRIIPGKYTILAVAEGFNPVTIAEVEVNRASLANYGFKLERSGSGNTLPEKRLDRNNPKWNIRASQLSRSIYQADEGSETVAVAEPEEFETPGPDETDSSDGRSTTSLAETFATSSRNGAHAGINYATLIPVNDETQLLFAAQVGIGRLAAQRFEAQINTSFIDGHQFRIRGGYSGLGAVRKGDSLESLGQISLQATDEWRVREGIILVYGVDYSKFVGAGGDFSISPRIGFQYDVDAKTRFRSSYTTLNEERTWSKAIELENAQVIFREPSSIADIVIEESRPVMNRSSRLEFGIERVLDNRSSIEINGFFDTVFARGVGVTAFDLMSHENGSISEFVGNQQGATRGVRAVYARRFSGILSAGAGYSFGMGQKISSDAVSDPESLFDSDLFHTLFGQVDVDLSTGTNIRTVFRLSPRATVFAIDPFQGRLAIYDPGLSVLVTQALPSLGLPVRAVASLDARNLLDQQTGSFSDDLGLRLNSHRRMLRGSILFRF